MKKKLSLIIVGMMVITGMMGMITFFAEDTSAASWSSTETVDSTDDVGGHPSISLDSDGNAHISYIDHTNDQVMYATGSRGNWDLESVRGIKASHTSITLDSDDHPHIIYPDTTENNLRYEKWTGTRWVSDTLDRSAKVGRWMSIDLDTSGNPHISYYDKGNADLKHANFTGDNWNIETVDSTGDVGKFTSLAVDGADNLHISYYDESDAALKYARWTGDSWARDTVDSTGDVGKSTSIGLDSSDDPHISYYDDAASALKYAKWAGGSWSTMVVDRNTELGDYTSLAVDSVGVPHISYRDVGPDKDLKYAKLSGDTWINESIDSVTSGVYPSLALNHTDDPHIAYYNYNDKDLKYVTGMVNTIPSKPQNLETSVNSGVVNLTWDAPSYDGGSSITDYYIYRGSSDSDLNYFDNIEGTMTSYEDTQVINGETYYYYVTAVNTVGEGLKSEEVSARPVTLPSAPQNLQASVDDSRVNLSWDPPSEEEADEIIGYRLYRGDSSEELSPLTTVETTSYSDEDVDENKTYYYRVSAINNAGEGNMSGQASADLTTEEESDSDDQEGASSYPWLILGLVILVLAAIAFLVWRDRSSPESRSREGPKPSELSQEEQPSEEDSTEGREAEVEVIEEEDVDEDTISPSFEEDSDW